MREACLALVRVGRQAVGSRARLRVMAATIGLLLARHNPIAIPSRCPLCRRRKLEAGELDDNMSDIKVRRLPVLDHDKRLVGIVSLGDIALTDGGGSAGDALHDISEPGGEHSQATDGGRGIKSA